MNTQALKQFIIDRAQEPSTWRGLVLFLTGTGCWVLPAGLSVEHVVSIGLTLAGAIGALSSDKKPQQS